MNDTIVVPPRISNTPPPIDENNSFDGSSNNSKSTDDFNNPQHHLDDSDLLDSSNNNDSIVIQEQNDNDDDLVKQDRSATLTTNQENDERKEEEEDCSSCNLEQQQENKSIENDNSSETINNEDASINSSSDNIVQQQQQQQQDLTDKDECEDLLNLSEDKLKKVIENLNITSDDQVVATAVSSEQPVFEEQVVNHDTTWDPFAAAVGGGDGGTEGGDCNNGDNWAAFDAFNTNSGHVEMNFDAFESESNTQVISSSNNFDDLFNIQDNEAKAQQESSFEANNDLKPQVDEKTVKDDLGDGDQDDDWDNFISADTDENVTDSAAAAVASTAQTTVLDQQIEKERVYYENVMRNASKMFEKVFEMHRSEFGGEFQVNTAADDDDAVDDYLFKNEEITKEWNRLLDFKSSECLKFTWRNSKIEDEFLKSVNIDKKNNNPSGVRLNDKSRYTTIFASDHMDNILQPTKVDSANTIVATTTQDDLGDKIVVVKPFDEPTTTTTTTDITSLGLNFDLSYLESKSNTDTPPSESKKAESSQASVLLNELLNDIYQHKTDNDQTTVVVSPPTTLVNSNELILTPQFSSNQPPPPPQQQQQQSSQQIIKTTNIDATTTNTNSKLSQKTIDLLDKLPNLNFMKSKVLMFPVHTTNSSSSSNNSNTNKILTQNK